ncbi:hypothetical protein HBB16_06415 [Pseudonocardia sp. MCCB 268]|nr:hypothetical protein [Pseudonocardia cytotoxica]
MPGCRRRRARRIAAARRRHRLRGERASGGRRRRTRTREWPTVSEVETAAGVSRGTAPRRSRSSANSPPRSTCHRPAARQRRPAGPDSDRQPAALTDSTRALATPAKAQHQNRPRLLQPQYPNVKINGGTPMHHDPRACRPSAGRGPASRAPRVHWPASRSCRGGPR